MNLEKKLFSLYKSFVSCFQLFGKSFFCLFLFFKIDFLCKVLPNISVEQHLGVEKWTPWLILNLGLKIIGFWTTGPRDFIYRAWATCGSTLPAQFLSQSGKCQQPTILDKIKWNRNAPSPPNQGWRCVKAKTRHFPITDFGGRGGLNVPFNLSKIVCRGYDVTNSIFGQLRGHISTH